MGIKSTTSDETFVREGASVKCGCFTRLYIMDDTNTVNIVKNELAADNIRADIAEAAFTPVTLSSQIHICQHDSSLPLN